MSCVRFPRENPSSLENYMKSRAHFFRSGLTPNRVEGRVVREEGEDSLMSIEDEFEETRRALHRMLKDAFEGKLGGFREPFIYGFTTRSRDARLENPRPALEGEEMRTRDPLVVVILKESAIFLPAGLVGLYGACLPAGGDGGGLGRARP